MTSDSEDRSNSDGRSVLRRRVAVLAPESVKQSLTLKLLILLLVGSLITSSVIAISYTAINQSITSQVENKVESDTTTQATVYANWLTERWSTLNEMSRAEEIQHDSSTMIHQWLVAEKTGVESDVDSLHVASVETGDILGSTEVKYHDRNLYDAGLNRKTTRSLIFISQSPVELQEDLPNMTLIGARSGERFLVAAVPVNTTLVNSHVFEGSESTLRSFEGERLIGETSKQTVELPETASEGTHMIHDGQNDTVAGVRVIAHDVLNAERAGEYDENTTVGTVVVTRAPEDEVFAVRSQILSYLVITFGLGLVLLIGTAAVSMRSVTKDINRLSNRARRISEGEFDVDVTNSRLDEIGVLYDSVDEMRDSLQSRIREVERRKDETEEAREELRHIIDLVPDPVFAKNCDGEYLLVNKTLAEYYGYSDPEEVEGKHDFEVVPSSEEAENFRREDEKVLESGESLHIPEDSLTTADGITKSINTTKIPFETVSGGERAILGYARDVTEIEKREEKYRSLFENTRDALMLLDRDGFFDCNETTLNLFDIDSVEEFIDYAPWELSPPTQPDGSDSVQAAMSHIERAFEEGEAFFEWTHCREDGTKFPAEVKLSRFEYEGEPALHALVRDITERKERQQKIRDREAKYRSLFEDSRDALMLFDRDGYIDCNQRALDLFGVDSVEEFLDYTPWELAPPTQPDGSDSKEVALSRIEEGFEEGEAFFEYTHQREDGTEFPAEVKLSRFEYEGKPVLHGLVRDITERKEYERKIKNQRDNLEVLNQMVRHDIRNDLQIVKSYSKLLIDMYDEGEKRDYIETVLENAESAIELTMTARDIADTMMSTEDDLEEKSLKEVLLSEIDEIESAYTDAEVRHQSLPDETVMANSMLGSVFRNLLKNAVEHNDKNTPEVTVSATETRDSVTVRVADNGSGVPDEKKDEIFGKGEKGIESEGTGMGLYLVHTLVESYGGEVWVEDNEPEGAVFVVELPRTTSD
ncbi:PAS domain S-box protein [Halorutilales archaeon Cl-col2-1]